MRLICIDLSASRVEAIWFHNQGVGPTVEYDWTTRGLMPDQGLPNSPGPEITLITKIDKNGVCCLLVDKIRSSWWSQHPKHIKATLRTHCVSSTTLRCQFPASLAQTFGVPSYLISTLTMPRAPIVKYHDICCNSRTRRVFLMVSKTSCLA